MTARLRLSQIISLYVLKQHRDELWQAIAQYIKERDDALRYFIPQPLGPFKTEWIEIN